MAHIIFYIKGTAKYLIYDISGANLKAIHKGGSGSGFKKNQLHTDLNRNTLR